MTRFPQASTLALELFNITFIGVNVRTGKKVLLTLALILVVYGIRSLALRFVRSRVTSRPDPAGFWSRQGIQLVSAIAIVLGVISIWVNPGSDLTVGLGLISAGLAFALQQVITAVAGYFVILRGDTFNVGDRISMGAVRGDVIRLGFMKTTVMEMGQPPAVNDADPSIWVNARQYTGRIVTVSNGKIFDEPVFNYTRDFPFVWDEMVLPVTYGADHAKAESILMAAVEHAVPSNTMSAEALEQMKARYAVQTADLEPRVFWRITDDWLELSVRFVLPARSARTVKDAMSRFIVPELAAAGIEVASVTYDIVGLPELRTARPHSTPD